MARRTHDALLFSGFFFATMESLLPSVKLMGKQ